MRNSFLILIAGLLSAPIIFGAPASLAHSGGLNAQGCHGGSRPYHCHRSPGEMNGNRLRCDLGSRSRECTSRSRSTSSDTVRQYQAQLMRHCPSLPSDFADGLEGPSTRAALQRFQWSYGIVADGAYGPSTAAALAGPVRGKCH